MTSTSRQKRTSRPAGRIDEMIAVVLLGIATIGTAWCGYEASRWNAEQDDLGRAASDLRVEGSREFGRATQTVSYDANMVAQYAQAVAAGNEPLQTFYRETLFRPAFLPVLDEWQAQIEAGEGPPPNLLEDEDYLSGELARYNELEAQAQAKAEDAQTAGASGDDYVGLTLLLASGLFFAGVTTSFRNRLPRLILLIASATAIGYAVTQILVLPVA